MIFVPVPLCTGANLLLISKQQNSMKKLFVSICIAIAVYLLFSFIGFSFTWIADVTPRIIYLCVTTPFVMYYIHTYE